MVDKQYSREQIFEAIKYWTQQLKVLDESINTSIDMLVDQFGEDLVHSAKFQYALTKEDIKKIYDILNFSLFNNVLGAIQLEFWPEAFIVGKMNENSIRSGILDQEIHEAPCYGSFSAISKDVLKIGDRIADIDIVQPIIMINKTYLKDCIFIFAVASICHEMIHYYDSFSKEFRLKYIAWKNDKKNGFDSHKDNAFQQMMRVANENGIDVEENLSGIPYATANMKAKCKLTQVLGEEDQHQTEIRYSNDMLIMKAKGSNQSMFVIFD